MFPLHSDYPTGGSFLNDPRTYVNGVKSLVDFAKEKEKVSFCVSGYGVQEPSDLKNLTPRVKKFLGIF